VITENYILIVILLTSSMYVCVCFCCRNGE